MKLKVLIVDDEPVARATIRSLVEADGDVGYVAECGDGREALQQLAKESADVLFLDVEMPEVNGFEVLAALPRERRPIVVFTTAFDHFATKAFDENATDYLLKPFSDERFQQALARAKESLRTRALIEAGNKIGSFADATEALGEKAPTYSSRLSIHREGRVDVVQVDDIEWIQSADQYVRLHTGDTEYLMRASMGELEKVLDPGRFARVHRSAIVAIPRVRRLETKGGGTGRVLLVCGDWVPVSRYKVPVLRRLLG